MSQTKPSPQQQQQQHQVSFGQHKNVHKISNQISQKKGNGYLHMKFIRWNGKLNNIADCWLFFFVVINVHMCEHTCLSFRCILRNHFFCFCLVWCSFFVIRSGWERKNVGFLTIFFHWFYSSQANVITTKTI